MRISFTIIILCFSGLVWSSEQQETLKKTNPNSEDFIISKEINADLLEQPISEDGTNFKVKYRVKPKLSYPKNMQEFGNRGKATLKFFVNKEGTVEKIITIDSAHPDLEQAAVQGMLKAKFYPTPTHWDGQQPIYLSDSPLSMMAQLVDPFKIPKASKLLPENLQYDEPPVIKVAAPLVYPLDLLEQNKKGKAKVYILIDPTGKVVESKILSASTPEFGLAAKASFQSWEFYPAKKQEQASWSVITKEYDFNLFNRDSRLSASATQILQDIKKNNKNFNTIADLDRIPKPLYSPMPVHRANNGKNSVQIEFYLDKDGLVQLPSLLSYDDEEQAWLALTAIKRWQFEVPTVNGQPVIAKLVLPIQFK